MMSCLMLSAAAFQFNGTVFDIDGNALNNTVINITIKDSVNSFALVGYNSTTTNATGHFNLTIVDNATFMYQPVITHLNGSYVDWVGQSLPTFPSVMIQEIAGTQFYLKQAGTINLTAINATGQTVNFSYQIKDSKLGYSVAESFSPGSEVTDVQVALPRDRNYSIMVYPYRSMPLSYNWNNFSTNASYNFGVDLSKYNVTTKVVHKKFNTSLGFAHVMGYINGSNITGWDEFTVIPYILEPGNMVHLEYGDMPYNLSPSFGAPTDNFSSVYGTFNMSLPSTVDTSEILLFATARNGSTYWGSFMNISLPISTYTNGTPYYLNFTMYRLLGNPANISMSTTTGGNANISTVKRNFTLINTSNISLVNVQAHAEVTVDYSGTISGLKEFTWMTDISQGSTASLQLPLLNVSGIREMNIYAGGGNLAPRRVDYTQTEIANDLNITLTSFDPGSIDDRSTKTGIKIALYKSNSSCDVPYPIDGCLVGGSTSGGAEFGDFNPIGAIMGGGKISFRMGLYTTGIVVHYVNVDMLASGPPDALFDSSSDEDTSGDFESAVRFGSGGPTTYDYVLVSMPYTPGGGASTGLDDSQTVNISIPTLYDDEWNIIWNTTANGTNATYLSNNFSHYTAKKSEWDSLLTPSNCVTNTSKLNTTSPCFINTTANRVWIRLPHFSGTGATLSGTTAAAATSSSSSSSSSSGGGGGLGAVNGIDSGLEGDFKRRFWTSIQKDESVTLTAADKAIGVDKVTFKTTDTQWSVWAQVNTVKDFPSDVEAYSKSFYKSFSVTTSPNLLPDKMTDRSIEFTVSTDWLKNNSVDKKDVVLFRFADKKWNEVPTTLGSESGGYVAYSASLPGFSYFVIGHKEPVQVDATKEETKAPEMKTDEAAKAAAKVAEQKEAASESNTAALVALIVILLAVIGGVLYFMKKR